MKKIIQEYAKLHKEEISVMKKQRAKEAQKIVHQRHLWKNRALEIDNIFTQS